MQQALKSAQLVEDSGTNYWSSCSQAAVGAIPRKDLHIENIIVQTSRVK